MNKSKNITEWVEYKVDKLLSDFIEKKIDSWSPLYNTENFSHLAFEEYFLAEIEKSFRQTILNDLNLNLNLETNEFNSADVTSDVSNDDDKYNCSLDLIMQDLKNSSETAKIRALKTLQNCTPQELLTQNSWKAFRKHLREMMKRGESEKYASYVLELYRRFLLSNDTPKIVCEGFVSLSETMVTHFDTVNIKLSKELRNEEYYIRTDELANNGGLYGAQEGEANKSGLFIIFKTMWLLVQSQREIPIKWNRFNEKKLREIIFSFIYMLSLTNKAKISYSLCGLEILSVLDPRAVWVSNWCHSATGRNLLCSALKTYKSFFNEVVQTVLLRSEMRDLISGGYIKSKNVVELPPLVPVTTERTHKAIKERSIKGRNSSQNDLSKFCETLVGTKNAVSEENHSAPPFKARRHVKKGIYNPPNNEKHYFHIINTGLSKKVVNEAKFCHCITMIVYLIQYRIGRSLFPIEIPLMRRRITIPDFVANVLTYINAFLFFRQRDSFFKEAYSQHLLKLLHILKSM